MNSYNPNQRKCSDVSLSFNKAKDQLIKFGALGAVLVLSACSTQIKQLPSSDEVAAPKKWEAPYIVNKQMPADRKPTTAPQLANSKPVENGWLNSFADDELKKYVGIALQNNPDILGSAANLKSAIERVTVDGANLWPSSSISANKTKRETEQEGVKTDIKTVSAALDIRWEADVWGKLTQRKKASALGARAQGELFKAAELSLVANVSRAWFNLVTNKLQLELAHKRLDSFERTSGLIEENYRRGLRSALDVYLSRTDVELQKSSLADSQFNYIQSLRVFKTLLGDYPDSNLEFEAKLPLVNLSIPTGLPAHLLTRRPDVKASKYQYESQIALAKAAHRDRFPSLTFSGSIGDSRDRFENLFKNDNMVMTLIGGVAQPIFQAGALKARAQGQIHQAEASYASFVKTTLNAFLEVEDALSRETSLKQQHMAIKKAVKFAQGGLDLALDRYQSGIENYTTVLQSQRRLFDSMRNEINLRNALLQNRIAIHLALGGDFSDEDDRNPLENLPSVIKTSSAEP